jgi:hypothetical protein
MNNKETLNELVKMITPQIAAGVLPQNVVRKLVNMGASQAMAEKVARIAEIEAAA